MTTMMMMMLLEILLMTQSPSLQPLQWLLLLSLLLLLLLLLSTVFGFDRCLLLSLDLRGEAASHFSECDWSGWCDYRGCS